MTTNEKKATFRLRHTASIQGRAAEARRLLGLSEAYFKCFGDDLRTFADMKLSHADAADVLHALIPDPPKPANPTKARNTRSEIAHRYAIGQPGANSDECRRTGYGLYNAVVDYVDHAGNATGERRFETALYGSGAARKRKALDLLLDRIDLEPGTMQSVQPTADDVLDMIELN